MADADDLELSRLVAQLALEDLDQLTADDPARAAETASQREYWQSFLDTIDEHRLVGNSVPAIPAVEESVTEDVLSSPGVEEPSQPGPSNEEGSVPKTAAPKRAKRRRCTACTEVIAGDFYRTICSHTYCPDCISSLVDACTRDETLFPPRCCNQPFELDLLFPFLNIETYTAFNIKRREYEVPAESRVYCPTPTCSRFLGSSANASTHIRCTTCRIVVCPRCFQAAHTGSPCLEDEATIEVRQMAQQERWATCHRCNAIVELNQGCYHITCRCRAEFCYLCDVPWKNCACPQWDEGRIIYAAEERVQAEVGPRLRMNDAVRHFRVRQMIEVLREHHQCVEHTWRRRDVPTRCENCRSWMPWYIYACNTCRTMMCGRCRFNRA